MNTRITITITIALMLPGYTQAQAQWGRFLADRETSYYPPEQKPNLWHFQFHLDKLAKKCSEDERTIAAITLAVRDSMRKFGCNESLYTIISGLNSAIPSDATEVNLTECAKLYGGARVAFNWSHPRALLLVKFHLAHNEDQQLHVIEKYVREQSLLNK